VIKFPGIDEYHLEDKEINYELATKMGISQLQVYLHVAKSEKGDYRKHFNNWCSKAAKNPMKSSLRYYFYSAGIGVLSALGTYAAISLNEFIIFPFTFFGGYLSFYLAKKGHEEREKKKLYDILSSAYVYPVTDKRLDKIKETYEDEDLSGIINLHIKDQERKTPDEISFGEKVHVALTKGKVI